MDVGIKTFKLKAGVQLPAHVSLVREDGGQAVMLELQLGDRYLVSTNLVAFEKIGGRMVRIIAFRLFRGDVEYSHLSGLPLVVTEHEFTNYFELVPEREVS